MPDPPILSLDGPGWQLYPLLPERWRWQQVWKGEPPGAAARTVAATVPGHVQSALLAAEDLPHPYQGLNSLAWEWTAARDWVYTREFTVPAEWQHSRVWLRFE